jgi:hypothetical protein
MGRRTFPYEYEFKHVEASAWGTFTADCGQLDTVALPDGTEVEITLSGRPMDKGQGEEALALARLIAKMILSSNHHQMQMEQTAEREDWRSYAPVVLGHSETTFR